MEKENDNLVRQAAAATTTAGGSKLLVPKNMDEKEYKACVEGARLVMREYMAISDKANKEALPKLYDVGLYAKRLFADQNDERNIKRFAGDCNTNVTYIYNTLLIVRAWTKGEFGKLINRGLTLSHIVRLVAVRSNEDRKDMANRVVSEKLTVAGLITAIEEESTQKPGFLTKRAKSTRSAKRKARDKQAEDPAKGLQLFMAKTKDYSESIGMATIGIKLLQKCDNEGIVLHKSAVKEALELAAENAKVIDVLLKELKAAEGKIDKAEKALKGKKSKG